MINKVTKVIRGIPFASKLKSLREMAEMRKRIDTLRDKNRQLRAGAHEKKYNSKDRGSENSQEDSLYQLLQEFMMENNRLKEETRELRTKALQQSKLRMKTPLSVDGPERQRHSSPTNSPASAPGLPPHPGLSNLPGLPNSPQSIGYDSAIGSRSPSRSDSAKTTYSSVSTQTIPLRSKRRKPLEGKSNYGFYNNGYSERPKISGYSDMYVKRSVESKSDKSLEENILPEIAIPPKPVAPKKELKRNNKSQRLVKKPLERKFLINEGTLAGGWNFTKPENAKNIFQTSNRISIPPNNFYSRFPKF